MATGNAIETLGEESSAHAAHRLRRSAVLWLIVTNLTWGWSFPVMKIGLEAIHGFNTDGSVFARSAFYMGWRFLLAALIYFALNFRRIFPLTRLEIAGGLTVGLAFTAGNFLQLVGLNYTHPSVSGFLTSLVVVFTPIAQALFLRRPPSRITWVAVGFALVGGVILSLSPDSGHSVGRPPFPYFGEIFTVLGALCFTGQILFLDTYGRRANTAGLTLVLFSITALLPLMGGLLFEGSTTFYRGDVLQEMVSDWTFQWTLITTVLFSSVIAFHLMNKYQPYLAPATAGVIYCLEPVFATIFSIILGIEDLRLTLAVGGAFILMGLILVARYGRPKQAT